MAVRMQASSAISAFRFHFALRSSLIFIEDAGVGLDYLENSGHRF
jgi:hypothetical protein